MKFLHLADLHLGKRVNGFDMLEDQRFILEQILTLCEKHGVEAVVIAGDIYDTPVPPAAACTLLDWFLTQLAARRIPVLAVSGNHDSAERLDFASSLLAEQNVHIAGRFTGCPKQVVLNDRHGPIEFTLLPFVRAATVLRHIDRSLRLKKIQHILCLLIDLTGSCCTISSSMQQIFQFCISYCRTDGISVRIFMSDDIYW